MSDPPPTEHQERSTPFSPEAEEAVLGAILSNPGAWFGIAAFLQQDDFFLLRHRWIWEAMQRISERNENLDFLTVGEELAQLGHLEETGGTAWLIRLINNTPTSVHAEVYGRIVQRAALRRRLLAAAESIRGVAMDEQQTIESVIEQSEALVFEATENRTRRDLLPLSDAISDYYERIEYLIRHSDTPLGLPTGFRAVEQLLGGMQRSDLLVFAGRPGMGKTSFMLSVVLNVARLGSRVALFTMEMGVEQIVQRLVSMETGINMQHLRLGQVSPQEQARLLEAMGRLSELQIFVDDTPALNPLELRAKCRRMHLEHGIDLILVDYMQVDERGRRLREQPRTRDQLHQPQPEGTGTRTQRAAALRRPAFARGRAASGQTAAAARLARIRLDRTGRRHCDVPLSRRGL